MTAGGSGHHQCRAQLVRRHLDAGTAGRKPRNEAAVTMIRHAIAIRHATRMPAARQVLSPRSVAARTDGDVTLIFLHQSGRHAERCVESARIFRFLRPCYQRVIWRRRFRPRSASFFMPGHDAISARARTSFSKQFLMSSATPCHAPSFQRRQRESR